MSLQSLSSTFAALGDPTRLAILSRLSQGEASVGELAKPFAMSQPAITKHLKVLEKAGLISRSRQAQWRPCRIEAAGLKTIAEWIEDYRKIWEARLDRLDEYIEHLKKTEPALASAPSSREKEKKHVRKK